MIALIFDTETTSLVVNHSITLDKQPSVIEYCGIMADLAERKELSSIELLIKPHEYPMSEKTIKESKTQLSNELLKDAQPFAFHADNLQRHFEAAPAVIAHNLSFDKEILDLEYERLGRKVKWPRRLICSVESTIHLQSKRLNLTNLHQLLTNTDFQDKHRARPDTVALMHCAFKMYEMGLL